MLGDHALAKFLTLGITGPVLDIGSGTGLQAAFMRAAGLQVITLESNVNLPADHHITWPDEAWTDWPNFGPHFNGVWTCHTLEHSAGPGAFLHTCREALYREGWLAVTVPPAKTVLVGGHVTLWTLNLLIYNLILAGFDCSKAMCKRYGYNLSVIVQKGEPPDLSALVHDTGDIGKLAQYWPFKVEEGCETEPDEVNW